MDKSSQSTSEAAEIARDFKEFTYLISHDLGAPVRGMVEFSRLLKTEYENVLDDEGKLYLSIIMESGTKLQKMLAALLDYSRLDSLGGSFTLFNSQALFEECRFALKDKIDALQAMVTASNLPEITADREQISKLFTILLSNALLFHQPGMAPSIELTAQKEGPGWQFTMQDNGIGIDSSFHQAVFQPFKKLHADDEYPGIGMGLALAKKIVTRHGGHIWITKTTDGKTAFHVTFLPKA